jgi:hypothetical protein
MDESREAFERSFGIEKWSKLRRHFAKEYLHVAWV